MCLLYVFSTLSQRIPLQALRNLPDKSAIYKSVRPTFPPFKKEDKKEGNKQSHRNRTEDRAVFGKVLDTFNFVFQAEVMTRT